MKKIAFFVLFGSVACIGLLTSCGDDSEGRTLEIVFDGESLSLSNADLYMTGSSEGSTHKSFVYRISDGEWNGQDFTDESFFLMVEVAVPSSEEFEPGIFPTDYGWSGFTGSNISWISFENSDFAFVPLDDSVEDILTVSGGFNDGETMTLSFDGPVDGNVEEVQLYFKGEVSDVRPM